MRQRLLLRLLSRRHANHEGDNHQYHDHCQHHQHHDQSDRHAHAARLLPLPSVLSQLAQPLLLSHVASLQRTVDHRGSSSGGSHEQAVGLALAQPHHERHGGLRHALRVLSDDRHHALLHERPRRAFDLARAVIQLQAVGQRVALLQIERVDEVLEGRLARGARQIPVEDEALLGVGEVVGDFRHAAIRVDFAQRAVLAESIGVSAVSVLAFRRGHLALRHRGEAVHRGAERASTHADAEEEGHDVGSRGRGVVDLKSEVAEAENGQRRLVAVESTAEGRLVGGDADLFEVLLGERVVEAGIDGIGVEREAVGVDIAVDVESVLREARAHLVLRVEVQIGAFLVLDLVHHVRIQIEQLRVAGFGHEGAALHDPAVRHHRAFLHAEHARRVERQRGHRVHSLRAVQLERHHVGTLHHAGVAQHHVELRPQIHRALLQTHRGRRDGVREIEPSHEMAVEIGLQAAVESRDHVQHVVLLHGFQREALADIRGHRLDASDLVRGDFLPRRVIKSARHPVLRGAGRRQNAPQTRVALERQERREGDGDFDRSVACRHHRHKHGEIALVHRHHEAGAGAPSVPAGVGGLEGVEPVGEAAVEVEPGGSRGEPIDGGDERAGRAASLEEFVGVFDAVGVGADRDGDQAAAVVALGNAQLERGGDLAASDVASGDRVGLAVLELGGGAGDHAFEGVDDQAVRERGGDLEVGVVGGGRVELAHLDVLVDVGGLVGERLDGFHHAVGEEVETGDAPRAGIRIAGCEVIEPVFVEGEVVADPDLARLAGNRPRDVLDRRQHDVVLHLRVLRAHHEVPNEILELGVVRLHQHRVDPLATIVREGDLHVVAVAARGGQVRAVVQIHRVAAGSRIGGRRRHGEKARLGIAARQAEHQIELHVGVGGVGADDGHRDPVGSDLNVGGGIAVRVRGGDEGDRHHAVEEGGERVGGERIGAELSADATTEHFVAVEVHDAAVTIANRHDERGSVVQRADREGLLEELDVRGGRGVDRHAARPPARVAIRPGRGDFAELHEPFGSARQRVVRVEGVGRVKTQLAIESDPSDLLLLRVVVHRVEIEIGLAGPVIACGAHFDVNAARRRAETHRPVLRRHLSAVRLHRVQHFAALARRHDEPFRRGARLVGAQDLDHGSSANRERQREGAGYVRSRQVARHREHRRVQLGASYASNGAGVRVERQSQRQSRLNGALGESVADGSDADGVHHGEELERFLLEDDLGWRLVVTHQQLHLRDVHRRGDRFQEANAVVRIENVRHVAHFLLVRLALQDPVRYAHHRLPRPIDRVASSQLEGAGTLGLVHVREIADSVHRGKYEAIFNAVLKIAVIADGTHRHIVALVPIERSGGVRSGSRDFHIVREDGAEFFGEGRRQNRQPGVEAPGIRALRVGEVQLHR